jgi:YggT family protein
VSLVLGFLELYEMLIIARALLSWFMPEESNQVIRFLVTVTEPVLSPMRALLAKIMPLQGLDLSPIGAMFLIELLKKLLH